jgi:hypothetical protein
MKHSFSNSISENNSSKNQMETSGFFVGFDFLSSFCILKIYIYNCYPLNTAFSWVLVTD